MNRKGIAMEYSIGDFAALLGQSADILRYYEKVGLLRPDRDPRNNYRRYSESQALSVMNLRMYRSFRMGLPDMRRITQGQSVREQNAELSRKRDQIMEQIQTLQQEAKRIEELKVFYDFAETRNGMVGLVDMEESYSLYVLGKGTHTDPLTLRLVREWMRHLPYTYFAVGIPKESLLSEDENLDVRLGVGVLEHYQKKLSLPLSKDVETFPKGECVYMHLSSSNPFELRKKDLSPLYEFVNENGLQISSEAVGRTFAEEYSNGRPVYYFSIRVLAEKIS